MLWHWRSHAETSANFKCPGPTQKCSNRHAAGRMWSKNTRRFRIYPSWNLLAWESASKIQKTHFFVPILDHPLISHLRSAWHIEPRRGASHHSWAGKALRVIQLFGAIGRVLRTTNWRVKYELEGKIGRLERILRVKTETDITFALLTKWIERAKQICKSI